MSEVENKAREEPRGGFSYDEAACDDSFETEIEE